MLGDIQANFLAIITKRVETAKLQNRSGETFTAARPVKSMTAIRRRMIDTGRIEATGPRKTETVFRLAEFFRRKS